MPRQAGGEPDMHALAQRWPLPCWAPPPHPPVLSGASSTSSVSLSACLRRNRCMCLPLKLLSATGTCAASAPATAASALSPLLEAPVEEATV